MVGESWNNPIDWYQTNSFSMIKLYNSIANTKLNGSGNYQTRQVGDDYRAQEFPNGTPTTANTYNLRIVKS